MSLAFDYADPLDATEEPALPVGHCQYHHPLTIEPCAWHAGQVIQFECWCKECGKDDAPDAFNRNGLGDTPEDALESYNDW